MKLMPFFRPLLTATLLSAITPAVARSETPMEAPIPEPEISVSLASTNPEPQSLGKPVSEDRFHESSSLSNAIDAYKKDPSIENRTAIHSAMAKLDLNIAQQEDLLDKSSGADRAKAMARLEELKKYRSTQLERIPRSANMAASPTQRRHLARVSTDERSPAEKAKDSALAAKDKVVSGAEKAGSKVKAGAKEAAMKTKDGAVTVADKVESGTKKVGRTVGKGFRKTGEAIEHASEPE